MCAYVYSDQKRILDSLALVLQAVESCQKGILETTLQSLKSWASFYAPEVLNFEMEILSSLNVLS